MQNRNTPLPLISFRPWFWCTLLSWGRIFIGDSIFFDKRLKFIKICIAKISNQPNTNLNKIIYIYCCLFVCIWSATQNSNAIHYSLHSEQIYWSSRWVFFALFPVHIKWYRHMEKNAPKEKKRKKIMNNWLIRVVERWGNNGKETRIHLL